MISPIKLTRQSISCKESNLEYSNIHVPIQCNNPQVPARTRNSCYIVTIILRNRFHNNRQTERRKALQIRHPQLLNTATLWIIGFGPAVVGTHTKLFQACSLSLSLWQAHGNQLGRWCQILLKRGSRLPRGARVCSRIFTTTTYTKPLAELTGD